MKQLKTYFSLISFLLTVILLFGSCDKFLDIQPRGYIIPTTVENYNRMLDNDLLIRYIPNTLDRLADTYYLSGTTPETTILNLNQRIYFWISGMFTPADYVANSAWHLAYSTIYQYNAIIENIDEATEGTTEQKNEIREKARLGRAIAYWYLVNLYAPPYNAATAETDLGIPIVLTANTLDAATIPARSSVADTYNFIISEMQESALALSSIKESAYQLRQTVAYGFLARTYLYMQDYENAIAMVDNVMETDNQLLNYNNIMTRNPTTGLYTYSTAPLNAVGENPEYIYAFFYRATLGMADQQVTNSFYNTYLSNPNDLRRAFYSSTAFSFAIRQGTYTDRRRFNVVIGPTVPEMYLIRAEAQARLGNTASALADLNHLRQRRFLASSYSDLVSSNATEVTSWILAERQRELVNKGLRWFDMRRLNNDPDLGFTAYRELIDPATLDLDREDIRFIQSDEARLEPNSPRYTLQLPSEAITNNVVQNPL